jgi:hypothetical protein
MKMLGNDFFEALIALANGAEELKALKLYLADCQSAGFEDDDISSIKTHLLTLLFFARINPNLRAQLNSMGADGEH